MKWRLNVLPVHSLIVLRGIAQGSLSEISLPASVEISGTVREETQCLYADDIQVYGTLVSPSPPPKPALPSYVLSPFLLSILHDTTIYSVAQTKHLKASLPSAPLHVLHPVLASLPLNYISDLTAIHHLQCYNSSLSHNHVYPRPLQ